jgi:hypothetical protein
LWSGPAWPERRPLARATAQRLNPLEGEGERLPAFLKLLGKQRFLQPLHGVIARSLQARLALDLLPVHLDAGNKIDQLVCHLLMMDTGKLKVSSLNGAGI